MTVVDEYQAATDELAASSVAGVLALYAALQAGGLAPATVVPAMAAVIATANAAATTLADVGVTAQIEVASGVPTPPTGIVPRDDTERLIKAVETILDDADEPDEDHADESDTDELDEPDEDAAHELDEPDEDADEPGTDEPDEHAARTRLERLARAEPLETGQAITVEIINRLPVVAGWTRKLDADPCERCVRWAEDGRVFPKDHHFKRHLNCNCQQEIVTTEGKAS